MFAGSGDTRPPRAREVAAPAAHGSHIDAAAARLAKAQRPLLVIGSQTLALVDDPSRIAAAVARLGIPVYLSGMARGLLGRDHPLQMHHQRRQALRRRTASCSPACRVTFASTTAGMCAAPAL
jgi:acetolactate synthase-1/2/3 large subunit